MANSKTENLKSLIANSLQDFSFKIALNVPGYGGTEVFNLLHSMNCNINSQICLNEEAAFSLCTGASLYGSRTALLVKAHGLAKMGNALTTSMSIGTNAANLIFVFDDVEGKSSDNILNTLSLIQGMETPFVQLENCPMKKLNMLAFCRKNLSYL